MPLVKFLALLLIVVGAINWGLWGIFQYDIVADIFKGNSTPMARFVYSLIGISGLIGITFFFCKDIYKCHCKKCDKPEMK